MLIFPFNGRKENEMENNTFDLLKSQMIMIQDSYMAGYKVGQASIKPCCPNVHVRGCPNDSQAEEMQEREVQNG